MGRRRGQGFEQRKDVPFHFTEGPSGFSRGMGAGGGAGGGGHRRGRHCWVTGTSRGDEQGTGF